jgi:hypothetical protein
VQLLQYGARLLEAGRWNQDGGSDSGLGFKVGGANVAVVDNVELSIQAERISQSLKSPRSIKVNMPAHVDRRADVQITPLDVGKVRPLQKRLICAMMHLFRITHAQ